MWKRWDWTGKTQSPLLKILPSGGLSLPNVAVETGGTKQVSEDKNFNKISCLAPLCYANAQQNLQENHPFYGHYTGQPALAGTSS